MSGVEFFLGLVTTYCCYHTHVRYVDLDGFIKNESFPFPIGFFSCAILPDLETKR